MPIQGAKVMSMLQQPRMEVCHCGLIVIMASNDNASRNARTVEVSDKDRRNKRVQSKCIVKTATCGPIVDANFAYNGPR